MQLTAKIYPSTASYSDVTWSVSDESIISINQDGLVTALNPGEAYVYAISHDATVTANILITVKPILIEKIIIPEPLTLDCGSQYEFSPEIYPEKATIKKLRWSVSDQTLGMMLADSNIFDAIGAGQVVITCYATDGSNVSASCMVDIIKRVQEVKLNEHDLTMIENNTLQLFASIIPIDATNQTILWSVTNDCIVVDETGLIEAKHEGFATIFAVSEDNASAQDECNITVLKDESGISDITIDEINIHFENETIVISGLPENKIVRLYAINGTLLNCTESNGTDIRLSVKANTTYILTLGNYSLKVVTR